ncbi:MAG TPA: hypothetical protein VFR02_02385, partial [bacterium]|nr:hypothetical protein [bacterium]
MEPRMVPPPPKRSFVKRFWPVLPLALLGLGLGGYADHRAKHPKIKVILPAPLPPAFETLPVGSVKPLGWLKQQMQLQASGLTGHLDEFWPDISQSGWIGGKGEGWERAPYWLDGLVPLAFELDDPALKQKARRWVDYILAHQSPDGWLGPDQGASNYGFQLPPNPVRDPWPQFVILKALAQYAEATGDPRVMPAMARDLANLDQQLDRRPLFDWSFFRWGDLLVTLDWMAARTGDPRWPRMEAKAAAQGYGWAGHFADFHERQKTVEWNFLS